MNIFWLDDNLEKCAEYHNSRHVVKQVLEYAQLLSTAHHVLDGDESPIKDRIYKQTHKNHPCAVWVRESKWNYVQTFDLLLCLCREYTYRYGKVHKVQRELISTLSYLPNNIPSTDKVTSKPVCMLDECKIYVDGVIDVVASYRNYYSVSKSHLAAWKNRNVPEWYIGELK